MAGNLDWLKSGGKSAPGSDDSDEDELACLAFGYLRGLRERAISIEFRFATGHCTAFPYSWLGPVEYDPSQGLLLRFAGDRVSLVLIEGNRLNTLVAETVSLFEGIQRHRITWVREMTRAELTRAGREDTTIDRIQIASYRPDEPCPVDWPERFAPPVVRG